jgi:hypothetical protein
MPNEIGRESLFLNRAHGHKLLYQYIIDDRSTSGVDLIFILWPTVPKKSVGRGRVNNDNLIQVNKM